jgi:hypothetical protein
MGNYGHRVWGCAWKGGQGLRRACCRGDSYELSFGGDWRTVVNTYARGRLQSRFSCLRTTGLCLH